MNRRKSPTLTLALVLAVWGGTQATAQSSDPRPPAEPASQLVLTSEVEWRPLNPARGDKGPQAGTLWGDRSGAGPSGFLVEFADGFSSPPHIHNVTYRGVVIRGLLHNDDPTAGKMWMPAGSYWTQPAGEVHITAAGSRKNLAYIEIEDGPYLVLPPEEAFDEGERPVNIDQSNIVWLDASNINWVDHPETPASSERPNVAFLWGHPQDDQLSGTLVQVPAGFTGTLRSHGSTFRAVVIRGRPDYRVPGESKVATLEPGSYFGSREEADHEISCQVGSQTCVIYVRVQGKLHILETSPSSGDNR